jgi:hypothetical protein
MKKSEHNCSTPGCENVCNREYPFCATCWRQVPAELRKPVRQELAKRGTPDLDRSALYYAVTSAAASVQEPQTTTASSSWERAWNAAGAPPL